MDSSNPPCVRNVLEGRPCCHCAAGLSEEENDLRGELHFYFVIHYRRVVGPVVLRSLSHLRHIVCDNRDPHDFVIISLATIWPLDCQGFLVSLYCPRCLVSQRQRRNECLEYSTLDRFATSPCRRPIASKSDWLIQNNFYRA